MRWEPAAIIGLFALAWATACGGGGGHDNVTITTRNSFPQGFLPVLLGGSSGRGDVAFRVDSDLFAVAGTPDLTVVSRENGDDSTHHFSGAGSLLSITPGDDGRLYVGNAAGEIWRITGNGTTASPFEATLYKSTGPGAITGLAFAPSGFGDFGGSLFAAKGTLGIRRVIISDTPVDDAPFADGNYVDLVFSGTTLLAIDDDRIVTVSASGDIAPLPSTPDFVNPVGITVDSTASEIYVADAGDGNPATPDGVLSTVPVAGGTPTKRARYDFDSAAPSGLAYDGLGAIAFVTSSPLAIRGSTLPRIDPANANFGLIFGGPTVGYGDLEFDRSGGFIVIANDGDSGVAGDSTNNFVFSVSRDGSSANLVASGIREPDEPGEQLLSLAIDPKTQAFYLGTDLGNLFRRMPDGTVTQLIDADPVDAPDGAPAMLGLELAPRDFCAFDPPGTPDPPCLVATTEEGSVIEIDPGAPDLDNEIGSEPGARLSDLVFGSDGRLFVVDCDDDDPASSSRILELAPNGDVMSELTIDGRVDGIEIDEGGDRLFVTALTAGADQLLEITLPISPTSDVNALANTDIDDGFFPTGVVYDRLGTAVLRKGNNFTALDAVDVRP